MNIYENDCCQISTRPGAIDLTQKLIKIANLNGGLALDVGCGYGHSSHCLKKNNFTVTGIDISEIIITKAKNNYKDIKFIVLDFNNLNTLEKFDCILCECTLSIDNYKNFNKLVNGLTETGNIIINDLFIIDSLYKRDDNLLTLDDWKIYLKKII